MYYHVSTELNLDPEEVLRDYHTYVQGHPIYQQHTRYAGIGLQTYPGGNMRDAVVGAGDVIVRDNKGNPVRNDESFKRNQSRFHKMINQDSEICKGVFAKVLHYFRDQGCRPYRSKFAILRAAGDLDFHLDASTEAWRVHLPIITNPHAYFEWDHKPENIKLHMPADGRLTYVRVDKLHRFVNGDPDQRRIHLVIELQKKSSELVKGLMAHA